jgi:hypothetical protein
MILYQDFIRFVAFNMAYCRGYNPGYTKVPLFINLYVLHSYFIYAGILKSKQTAAWAGLTKPRPEYTKSGRHTGVQAGTVFTRPE